MNPNKQCIISFATLTGNYIHGISRLSESLRNNFDGDFLAFIGEATCGAEPHADNPYNFKIHCIQRAIDAGYEKILWLDSSCFAIRPIQPIFDHIAEHGYIMQDAGHYIGTWTNDRALDWFAYSRDEAMQIKMYGNAGFLGLDFSNPTAQCFFEQWTMTMKAGLFKGAWHNNDKTESQDERCTGHRHDMSLGSIIAHELDMKLQPGDEWLQYAGVYQQTLSDRIYIKAAGL